MDLLHVAVKIWDLAFYTILPFVGVLGIMIFVHELGHYLAARAVGVRVLVFKIGFGRYIWSFKRGHTEYGVAWFPIGGYVRMFGDPTEAEDQEVDTPLEEISEEDKKAALFYRPAWQKMLVFVSGAAMNIVLAFVVAPMIYLIGTNQQVLPAAAGRVEASSPAAIAGIIPGDTILAIDGDSVETFQDLALKEALNPNKPITYVVMRDGQRLEFTVKCAQDPDQGIGFSGIMPPPFSSEVGALVAGSVAEKAGLLPGDTIISIGGIAVGDWLELQDAVAKVGGEETTVVALRGGRETAFTLTPEYNDKAERFLLGITYHVDTKFVRYGLGQAITEGAKDAMHFVTLTFEILWKLVRNDIPAKTVSGPLGIGAITSEAARSGLTALMSLMVLISINLGILNLLPFPPLDGGHVVVTGIEGVLGREIKMKYKEMAFRFGFFLLIGLMILVTAKDFWHYKGQMYGFFVDIFKGFGL